MWSTVKHRLSHGVDASEVWPTFDPHSKPVYAVIAAVLLTGALLAYVLGFSFERRIFLLPPWTLIFLALPFLLRRIGHPNIGGTLECLALAYAQGVVFILLIFPLTALSRPLADAQLARLDLVLGLDWRALATWVDNPLLAGSYYSFILQPLILLPLLFACRRGERAWTVVTAATVALLTCAVIYPFFPAVGAYRHYGIPVDVASNSFGAVVEAIKNGERAITLEMCTGLISFPSYHAAGATIYTWAARPLPLVAALAFAALNAAMIVATVPMGAHYIIDVIVGVGVGLTAIQAAKALVQRHSRQAHEVLAVV